MAGERPAAKARDSARDSRRHAGFGRVVKPAVLIVLVVASVAGAAWAAASLVYETHSTANLQIEPPPLQFETGNNSNSKYVISYTRGVNLSIFSLSLDGKPGTAVKIQDFGRGQNVLSTSFSVTISGAHVADSNITTDTITFRQGGTALGTLDFLQPSPSTSFTVPANALLYMDAVLQVKSRAPHTTSTPGYVQVSL
ncbi:MAG: hypothetical protein ACYDDF_15205 [Thermoplasmatota archaeon]